MLGLRHYQKRKHAPPHSGLPAKRSAAVRALDLLIYPAAIASPLALVPQALALYTSHNASGLVVSTWAILGVLNIVWLIYGLVHKEKPIILTNAALMILNFAIALGAFLYS